MNLWTCKNCGVVFTDKGYLEIKESEDTGEYYISKGACPGCGGNGVLIAQVEK